MLSLDLNGKWRGSGLGDDSRSTLEFDAVVPGCVHTDLLANGLIDDPFWRDNVEKQQWIERWSWVYSREFTLDAVPPDARLVFDGLDTFCDVYLNGFHLGQADDMFIPHEFDASRALRTGENALEVRFYPPVTRMNGRRRRNAAFDTPERLYARKMQCTYGWDWVARYVTSGIFRGVRLESRPEMHVESVYVYTDALDSLGARVTLDAAFANYSDGARVLFELISPRGETVYSHERYVREEHAREFIDVASPELWYPLGYGAQPLYTLRVTVRGNVFTQTLGIRTLRLLKLPDAPGSDYYEKCRELQKNYYLKDTDLNENFAGFIVAVNGVKIMCKGADWVPCSPFPSEESDGRITRILELASGAGVNTIRVWGGGLFEKERFYSECDRLGILVAQDFLMACGDYPENETWFVESLRNEARYAAKLLRNHACFGWWHGDNENATGACDTDESYTGRESAFGGAEPVLRELDYTRELLPSSPFGGDKYSSVTVGTAHNTNYLGAFFDFIESGDAEKYKEHILLFLSRFTSEEPTLGAVSERSLRRFMTEEDIFGGDETIWREHTKNNPYLRDTIYNYTKRFAEMVLGAFEDGRDRLFKLEYLQYEWIRLTLGNYRRNKWFSAGIIYWMLNDCWPASSGWALIDYYCEPKASYYAFRKAASAVAAFVNRIGDGLELAVGSDILSDTAVRGSYFALDTVSGAVRDERSYELTVPANESVAVETVPGELAPNELAIFEIEYGGRRDRAFYRDGSLKLRRTDGVATEYGETSVTLCAEKYVHAIELTGARFGDNYFSLLPGETRTVSFTRDGDGKLDFVRGDLGFARGEDTTLGFAAYAPAER